MVNLGGSEVTIYDIAEAAGVSPSTVSRTFSRPDRVSFRTAEKIRAVAAELGYKTDPETLPEKHPDSKLIGLVIPDVTNPFFQELYRGAQHVARIENMSVALIETFGSFKRAKAAVERMAPFTAGLLLASTRLTNGEIRKVARGMPTVVLNRPVPNVPSVLVDNYDGSIKGLFHLADQGVSSVTYLAGPVDSWADAMRWRGLLDAVGKPTTEEFNATETRSSFRKTRPELPHHITLRQTRIDEPTITGGRRAFEAWRQHPTDAVMCFNDVVAIGFIDQARRAGVNVPEDVAVIGFDNTEITAMFPPGLTTVAAPLRTVGRVACANLIALTRGIKLNTAKPRVLPTRLIVRGSTVARPTAP